MNRAGRFLLPLWLLPLAWLPYALLRFNHAYWDALGCPVHAECEVPGAALVSGLEPAIILSAVVLWPVCLWFLLARPAWRLFEAARHRGPGSPMPPWMSRLRQAVDRHPILKAVPGMALLLSSLACWLMGIQAAGAGLLDLFLNGASGGPYHLPTLFKGLALLALGYGSGRYALRLLRPGRQTEAAQASAELLSAIAADAPPRETEAAPTPSRGTVLAVLSIALALGGYLCFWLALDARPKGLVERMPMWIYFELFAWVLPLAGLVCAIVAMARRRGWSLPIAVGLLLNAVPMAYIMFFAILFNGPGASFH